MEALSITKQRGIINKGWGGLGNCKHNIYITVYICSSLDGWPRQIIQKYTFFFSVAEPKDFVYSLDNVPHDWLFLQCKAVVSLRFNAYGICYCYFWLLYEARSFMTFIEESRNLIICGFIRFAGVCLCMTLCDSCIGS